MSSTAQKSEIEKFSKDAASWWDKGGPFSLLHRLNPVRIEYLKSRICDHYDRDIKDSSPFRKLDILDVGCGGGLVCEPLTALGAKVIGIDADEKAVQVAKEHAKQSNLKIDYQEKTVEDIKKKFDVILALEIIEHVTDLKEFTRNCAAVLKPDGLMIFSTLNRTPKSFALGIVAAEYLLRWVPKGTHSWNKFVKPSELAEASRKADLKPEDLTGLVFNPLDGEFRLSDSDIDMNYFMACRKFSKP